MIKLGDIIPLLYFIFCICFTLPAATEINLGVKEKAEARKALLVAGDLQGESKYQEAIEAYEEILRKYPGTDVKNEALMELAQAYNRFGDRDSAIQTYFKLISDNPNTAEASQSVSLVMNLYYQRYQFDEVIAIAESIMQQFPKTQAAAMAMYRSASYLYSKREYQKAIQRYEDFIKQFPESIMGSTAFNRLVALYIRAGMFGKAEHILLDKLQENPTDKYMLRQLAHVYQKQGNYDRALELYQQILADNPNDINTYELLGELYAEKGDRKRAIAEWSKITESAPGQYSRHQMLAHTFKSHGFYDEAAKEYRTAIELRPGVYYLHTQLANVYVIQKQFDAAIDVYLDALMSLPVGHPDRTRITTEVLELCDLEGLYDRAIPRLEANLEGASDNVPTLLTLADFHFHRDNFNNSLQNFKKIASLYPDEGRLLFDHAAVLERQQKIHNAVAFHRAVSELFPQSNIALQALFHIGQLQAQLNQPQAAIDNLRTLISKTDSEKTGTIKQSTGIRGRTRETRNRMTTSPAPVLWLSAHILIGDIHLQKTHEAQEALAMYIKAKLGMLAQIKEANTEHARLPDLELKIIECYRLLERYDEAEEALDFIQAKYKTRSVAARIAKLRGDCYFSQGNFDEALVQYQSAIQGLMNESWVNNTLEKIVLVKGHSDHGPQSILRAYARIEILRKLGQYREALNVCISAVERYSGRGNVDRMQLEMGEILALQTKSHEAVSAYEELIHSESPLAAEAQFRIARIYWEQLSDSEQAVEAYSKLIESYPNSVLIADARKHIRELASESIGTSDNLP